MRQVRLAAAGGGLALLAGIAVTSLHISSPGGPPAESAALEATMLGSGTSARAAAQAAVDNARRLSANRGVAAVAASRAILRRPFIPPIPRVPLVVIAPPPTLLPSSAHAWANTPFAIRVANCESGGGWMDLSPTYDGNPHLRDANGHYGKWQFAPATWWGVGGTGNPADASEAEQDYRAWLLWKRDGWAPWECAHLVTRG